MLKKNSKVRIEWKDFYHNITKPKIEELKEVYANKLGISKNDVEIVKKYIQTSKANEKVSNVILDSVLNPTKLQENYKHYITSNYPDYDQAQFFSIDAEVAKKMVKTIDEFDTKDRSYKVKYISGKNIFSYGGFERDYSKGGVTLIHSNPENAGGKSSLVRLLPFLIYGNEIIYGHNRASYDRVFNRFTEERDAYIEGELEIGGSTYYLKRSFKKNSKGKVSNKFFIYRFDETADVIEELGVRAVDLREKNAIKSLKKFKAAVGTYEEYVFASYYEYHNIEKWIQTKAKKRYRLFCEYLGLGLIEEKYQLANDLLRSHVKNSVSTKFNVEELTKEIETLNSMLEHNSINMKNLKLKIKEVDSEITIKTQLIKKLYGTKYAIDSKFEEFSLEDAQKTLTSLEKEITSVNGQTLELSKSLELYDNKYADDKILLEYTTKLKNLKKALKDIETPKKYLLQITKLENSIDTLETPIDIQNEIETLKDRQTDLTHVLAGTKSEIITLQTQLGKMPDEVTCKKCGAVEDTVEEKIELQTLIDEKGSIVNGFEDELDTVDEQLTLVKKKRNKYLADETKALRSKIAEQQKLIQQHLKEQQGLIYEEIDGVEVIIQKYNSYEKLLLQIKNVNHKKTTLNTKLNTKQSEIDEFIKNKSVINENIKINNLISDNEESIKDFRNKISLYNIDLKDLESSVTLSKYQINEKQKLIDELETDYEREKHLKFYLKIHGDDGISKHIINSILPQINSELGILMGGMDLDFELSIRFDDKKIEFMVEKDGQIQHLHDYSGFEVTISCLALHYINVKMTTLPIPNVLVLDEVVNRINHVNFSKFVKVLNKLAEVFDTVDVITHYHAKELKKYIDNSILITKENNISKIK